MYSMKSMKSKTIIEVQDADTDFSTTQFTIPMSTTPGDGSLLSPPSIFNPYSNSSTPSHLGTSLELTSDAGGYSDFTEYNGGDEFYGVNFDANGEEIDFATAILGEVFTSSEIMLDDSPSQHSDLEATILSLPRSIRTDIRSPTHTTSSETESPKGTSNLEEAVGIGHRSIRIKNTSTRPSLSNSPGESANLRQTPDMTGCAHERGEKLDPNVPSHMGHSPRLTLTTWGSMEQRELSAESGPYGIPQKTPEDIENRTRDFGEEIQPQSFDYKQDSYMEEEQTRSENPKRTGVDPERRRSLSGIEITSLKELNKLEQLEEKKREILEWQSQAEPTPSAEQSQASNAYTLAAPDFGNRRRAKSTGAVESQPHIIPELLPTPQQSRDPEEGLGLEPMSDSDSIRENRLIEGQIYYNHQAIDIKEDDLRLMQLSRIWNDPPSYAHIIKAEDPNTTAQDAINRFNAAADSFSLLSRSATWGTRRRSEPSLADIASIKDGTLLKRLSFGRGRDKKPGILENLTSIVRKKSDANKLKREREARGRPEALPAGRKESQSTLAPPTSPSASRRRPTSPRLDTSVASSSAHGASHSRHQSTSATLNTSPKNTFGFVKKTIRRARSRSDINDDDGPGLVGLLRQQGGPPVAKLASPPPAGDEGILAPEDVKLEQSDLEGDDEEDEEFVDEGDMGVESEPTTPITPTFSGFQSHVLMLNPTMESGYLVDRIAHQQVVRYKGLLQWRVKHLAATVNGVCSSGAQCIASGGSATLFEPKRRSRDEGTIELELPKSGDGSDNDGNPEANLVQENFPPGVPMPPAQRLPAEFECQLCFKVKKFNKPSDWTKHVHEDVQPFTCSYQNCREPKSFKRKADWVRHENERHRHLEWWTCQVEDCTHKCFRKDNFLQHLVREHKYPEPKLKSKAAVKRARGADEAIWQVVRSCHHETTNRPQDEPCKFCGKILTSWKKLTVHLAKHMEQISLPVLRIVTNQQVDANTIISPVEPLVVRQPPPIPLTREASENSNQYSHTISPNIPSTSQFSPMYAQSSSSISAMPLFQEGIFGHDQQHLYGLRGAMDHQQQPGLVYNAHDLQYANPRSAGFASMDQSPLLDDGTQNFTAVNQLYNIPHHHQPHHTYGSFPSSAHKYSPGNQTAFVSAPPQPITVSAFIPQPQQGGLHPDSSAAAFEQTLFDFTGLNVQARNTTGFGAAVPPGHHEQSMGLGMGRSRSHSGNGNAIIYPPSTQGYLGEGGGYQ